MSCPALGITKLSMIPSRKTKLATQTSLYIAWKDSLDSLFSICFFSQRRFQHNTYPSSRDSRYCSHFRPVSFITSCNLIKLSFALSLPAWHILVKGRVKPALILDRNLCQARFRINLSNLVPNTTNHNQLLTPFPPPPPCSPSASPPRPPPTRAPSASSP
jgi:hypothetical protein